MSDASMTDGAPAGGTDPMAKANRNNAARKDQRASAEQGHAERNGAVRTDAGWHDGDSLRREINSGSRMPTTTDTDRAASGPGRPVEAKGSEATQRRIFVIMGVYKPKPDHLEKQVQSLLSQTWQNIQLLAVLDGRDRKVARRLREFGDDRIHVVAHDARVGVYENFKRGLAEALDRSTSADDLFAFCDQDDWWEPHKLERQVAELERTGAGLCHSDAAFVDDDGEEFEPSMFAAEKRSDDYCLLNLVLINAVTGMTAVMTREVAENARNFPLQSGTWFHHDLWVAMVASSLGKVAVVREPLVRYRQHDSNVVGQAILGRSKERFEWKRYRTLCETEFLKRNYLVRHLRSVTARDGRDLASVRAAKHMFGTGLFGAEAFLRAAWLRLKGERRLAKVAMRMAIGKASLTWRSLRKGGPLGLTRRLRGDLIERAATLRFGLGEVMTSDDWRSKVDRRMLPLGNLRIDPKAPRAVNLLVPTLNPEHIFAGIATAIDFAIRFRREGFHVRIMATDLPVRDNATSRNFVLGRLKDPERSELSPVLAVFDARAAERIDVGPDDVWLVSAWWSTYVAEDAITRTNPGGGTATGNRLVYMIQDFEPGFYAWSEDYANALGSYSKKYVPVFNTTILRDYFLERFPLEGRQTFALSPSLHLERYGMADDDEDDRIRLIVYGRPSVERNMFKLAVHALAQWIEQDGITASDIEIVSAGEAHANVELPNGVILRSLGKASWADYPALLASGDMGLSLMLSPHPSHIPLEMAASGVVCVTNTFENKDLSEISDNIVSVPPTLDDLTEGLRTAAKRTYDRRARHAASKFRVELGQSIDDTVASVIEHIE